VRQIFPAAGPELKIIPSVTAGRVPAEIEQLAALYRNGQRDPTARGSWLRANMISSVDGAAALEGRSGGLGGPADKMIFGVLRSLADVILVGAGTARAERYRPVGVTDIWAGLRAGITPAPALAVISTRLDLTGSRLFAADQDQHPGARTILLTTASAPAGAVAAVSEHAEVIVAGDHAVDIAAAVSALAARQYRSILVEGGPHLLGQLAQAGLLDELCLTISPVLAAGTATRIAVSGSPAPTRLTLAHVLADGDYMFARYIRARD
jgi:riboflavin biosynthesis pyrimidine reductase